MNKKKTISAQTENIYLVAVKLPVEIYEFKTESNADGFVKDIKKKFPKAKIMRATTIEKVKKK